MKILPVAALALFGTSLPLAAQTMKLPVSLTGRDVPVRTQEYEAVAQSDAVDGTTQAANLKFKRVSLSTPAPTELQSHPTSPAN